MTPASTRDLLDRSFTALGWLGVLLMAAPLAALLGPIMIRGAGAVVFRATIEHRRAQSELFGKGRAERLRAELAEVERARRPVYAMLADYERELEELAPPERARRLRAYKDLRRALSALLGPLPNDPPRVLLRDRYGQTRWDRALVKLKRVLYVEEYAHPRPGELGQKTLRPRRQDFEGTALEPLFDYLPAHVEEMLRPRWTFYGGFFTDPSRDAHFFGGIGPEILGTFYLATGSMLFAIPLGVIAAIYLIEFAREGRLVRWLRACVSTLAGVPSIVFGLFGLTFFIHTLRVSPSKSVLAGALTLALLVLPTVIRASEEALRAVPATYREAALSLGASRWQAVRTVILPAALPGILTGIIVSLGRAAGETAPIIFTAAVSVGKALKPWQTLTQPTPALPWNVYNLCAEHEAADEIRHVQYGMVASLALLVLLINLAAIVARARLSRRLRV